MIKLSKQQVNSIAQDLDMGMNCYVHKITGKTKNIPAKLDEFDDNFELWQEELNEIEKNRDQYILIEKMHSSDSFRIMRRFLGKVSEPKLRNKLMIAISQNKPLEKFRNILDYNGDALQDWYDFKQREIERYVNKYLDDLFKEEE